MNLLIILKITALIEKAEKQTTNDVVDRIAKNNKLIGLYEALNAVYDVINEEHK